MREFFQKLLFISCFVSVVMAISSCDSQNEKRYTYKEAKSLNLTLDSSFNYYQGNFLSNFQMMEINGKEMLSLLFDNQPFLYCFDMETQNLQHKIPLQNRPLLAFNVQGEDSVLLLYQNYGFADSTLFQLVDFEGKVRKNYRFNQPVWSGDNPEADENKAILPVNYSGRLKVHNQQVLLLFDKYRRQTIGTPEFFEHKTPIAGVFNLETEMLRLCENYWYPGVKAGVYFPNDTYPFRACFNDKGNPVIRFMYSPVLTEWNLSTNDLIEHRLASKVIDTITPACFPVKYTGNEVPAQYYDLSFDPYRKIYHSLMYLNHFVYGKKIGWLYTFANEDCTQITEFYKPPFVAVDFTRDYVITAFLKGKDKVVVKYFEVRANNGNQVDEIAELRQMFQAQKDSVRALVRDLETNCNTTGGEKSVIYLHNTIGVPESDFVIVTVFIDKACLGCRDFVLDFLSKNKTVLSQEPLYILLSSENENVFDEVFSQYNLSDYTHLKADKNGVLNKMRGETNINPRITVVKDNKIVLDTVYLPDQLSENFIQTLADNLENVEWVSDSNN